MVKLVAYLRYLRILLWHKTCILTIGCWVNWQLRGTSARVSFARLFFHDWVKFLPFEFIPYAKFYSFPRDSVPEDVRLAFRAAYEHHYQRMDHHWEYHVTGYNAGMNNDQIQANAQPMPVEAVVEAAVDALGAQYSYDGSWPPPDWSRLSKLSASPRYHPSTLALLCVIWSYLGFPHPLLSLQNGITYGLSVAAATVNSHAPYAAVFTSLRAAMQESSIPFRYTVAYFARLLVDALLFFGLPTAALTYGLSRSSRVCLAVTWCREHLQLRRK